MIVEINGKKVGINFNNYAIEQLPKLKNLDQSGWGFVYALVFCGYQGWKFVKENQPGFEDPEITFENVVDWVDSSTTNEVTSEEIKQIFELYKKSQAYLRLIKNLEEEQKKTNGEVKSGELPTYISSPLES